MGPAKSGTNTRSSALVRIGGAPERERERVRESERERERKRREGKKKRRGGKKEKPFCHFLF